MLKEILKLIETGEVHSIREIAQKLGGTLSVVNTDIGARFLLEILLPEY